jgi:hypothetical protein
MKVLREKRERGAILSPGLLQNFSLILGLFMVFCFPGREGVSSVRAAGLVAQDLDGDGDVDRTDFDLLQACLTGPNTPRDGSTICVLADTDQDGDVDQTDFGVLQVCYSGPGIPADPSCGGCALPRPDLLVTAGDEDIPSGASSSLMVHGSQAGASYQLRDDADNRNVGDPVTGNGGTINLPTGVMTQTTTFNVLAVNTLWGCSAELSATATITVSPYENRNKIGVHVVIGARNGYGPFIQNCAAAGKPVALVKCVDDYGAAWESKQHSPQTVTIGRQNTMNGHDLGNLGYLMADRTPHEAAQWVYDLVKPKWVQNPWIDIWEVCNEWDSDYTWQADFYIAMMDLVEPDGYRLALWSSSLGTPGEQHYPEVARTCLRAKSSGGHILALHEYAFFTTLMQDAPTSVVTRYRRLYNYLATHGAVVPLALTEVGQGGGYEFVGTELFVQDYGWYDSELRKDWYVIGCAAWTLGNWQNANFQNALPALTQYIVSH